MNEYCIFAQYCITSIQTYIRPHTCPRDLYFLLCITPINPRAFEHWEGRALPLVETDEMCSSPAASINPSKMDTASPTAAGPPGKLRGSDCSGSTGTECAPGGETGLHYFYFPSQYTGRDTWPKDQRLKRTSRDAIDQDYPTPPARSERCLVANGTPASAPGGTFGGCTPAPTGSPRGTDGSFREEALTKWVHF